MVLLVGVDLYVMTKRAGAFGLGAWKQPFAPVISWDEDGNLTSPAGLCMKPC